MFAKYSFSTLMKSSPQLLLTGKKEGFKVPSMCNLLFNTYTSLVTWSFFSLIHSIFLVPPPTHTHTQSFNISSLCSGSWHPCVRSKPLSPALSALSKTVSCSCQRVQTRGVNPRSWKRGIFFLKPESSENHWIKRPRLPKHSLIGAKINY